MKPRVLYLLTTCLLLSRRPFLRTEVAGRLLDLPAGDETVCEESRIPEALQATKQTFTRNHGL